MEQILLSLALMLLFAKLLGMAFERFGIASMVGQILAGIVLGPVLGWVLLGDFMEGFMTFGILFLIFIAGTQAKFDDIRKNSYRATLLATAGGLVSFFLGFIVGMAFFNNTIIAMAIGTAIVSTSNGALFLILMRSGRFDTKVGKLLVATTIADDIVGILVFSLFNMQIKAAISFSNLFFILLVSLGFYLFVLSVGSKVVGRILDRITTFTNEEILFTLPVAIMFLLAFVTDNLELSMIAGAFLAGMSVANSRLAQTVIVPKVSIISEGLLLPVFFAAIGTMVVFTNINVILILAIVAAAVVGKFIGCGMTSGLLGFSWDDMKTIGLGMIPRGDENMAFLRMIMILGVIGQDVYSSIAFAIVITTVLAPIMMKVLVK
jgi:Kef-type K+ transport system membrane component KefB